MMTIKQQGGIFGRNPSFNDVDVNKLDVDNIQIDGSTISSTNSNGNVLIDPNGTGNVVIPNAAGNTYAFLNGGNSTAGGSNPWLATLNNADPASATFGWSFYNNDVNGNLDLYVTSGGVSSRIMTFTRSTGHADLTGNLAFASGNGIDFSATSGTGTSELFDDYEEGTWTPTLAFGGGSVGITYAVQEGAYTKIGRQVTLTGRLLFTNIGSSTGAVTVTGLPFNAGTNYPASLIDANTGFTGLTAPTFFVLSSGTLYMSTQGAADRQNVTNASFTNGADMRFLVTYFV